MNGTRLTITVILMALLGGTQTAFALSSQSGQAVPGAFVNLADPDDQTPVILKRPGSQSSSEGFDSGFAGQAFVNQDIVNRSIARKSGSYIQPEPQK
jgi:hypothetical protein